MKLIKYSLIFYAIIALIFSFSTLSAQNNYQAEVGAMYLSQKNEDKDTMKLYGVGATMYFTPVNSNHPFAEASFLERVGSVSLFSLSYMEKYNESDIELDGPEYEGEITYMQSGIPVTITIGYELGDIDIFDSAIVLGNISLTRYNFGMGIFLRDGFLLGFNYSNYIQDNSFNDLDDYDLDDYDYEDNEYKENEYKIYAKFVKELIDGTAFNIESGFIVSKSDWTLNDDDESNNIIGFAGDYYFNNNFSIGSGIKINIGDDKNDEGKTISIDSSTLIRRRFLINLEYEKFIADDTEEDDYDTFFAAFSIRF